MVGPTWRDTATSSPCWTKGRRTALSRALNHEGDKSRALVKQTGIRYGAVDKAMATIRATPATLTYTLKARGDETFARSFIVPRFGRAFIHTSKKRLPIRLLYGPNLAREVVKGQQRGCVAGRRCEARRARGPRESIAFYRHDLSSRNSGCGTSPGAGSRQRTGRLRFVASAKAWLMGRPTISATSFLIIASPNEA